MDLTDTSNGSLSLVNAVMKAISDFRHDVNEISALLGCYAALSGIFMPTLRDNLSAPSVESTIQNMMDSIYITFLPWSKALC
jgi:hypothetical protein